ncbi:hypothetical protein CCP2SC5_670004 [Azospirillaceae bacterium]
MTNSIRILHVEDSENDHLLLKRALRRGGMDAVVQRVEIESDYRRFLVESAWDVVISDCRLPKFSGAAAVEILRADDADLPFILVSGAIGEEEAAAMMRAGAHDFIIKDNLARLIPTIERALQDAAARRGYREAEKALRRSEQRLNLALDAVNDGVWDWAIDSGVVYYSPRWYVLHGLCYENSELEPTLKMWDCAVHSDDLARVQEARRRHLAGETPAIEVEHRVVLGEQRVRWVLARGRVVERDAEGLPLRVCGTTSDLTSIKNTELVLRKLICAVEQSPAAILMTNREGLIEYVNPRMCEITGYQPEEILGRTPRMFKSGHISYEIYRDLWSRILAGEEWRGELLNRRRDESLFWVSASVSPLRDPDGAIVNFVAVEEDITRQKQVEDELRQAMENAELASRAKLEFIANMSHELRTPLNAIIGMASLLKDNHYSVLSGTQTEWVEEIHQAGIHLLDLLNDVLDLSRFDMRKVELADQDVDVSCLIEHCVVFIQERADAAGVSVFTETSEVLPLLRADQVRVARAVMNLLSNAVKFTLAGGWVRLSAGLDSEGGLFISVADSGIGMAPEQVAFVLQPFRQVESGLDRRFDGLGLGLTIAKRLIDMHDADLTIKSALGVGATVTLRFPPERVL